MVIHYEEALYQVYAPLPLPVWTSLTASPDDDDDNDDDPEKLNREGRGVDSQCGRMRMRR